LAATAGSDSVTVAIKSPAVVPPPEEPTVVFPAPAVAEATAGPATVVLKIPPVVAPPRGTPRVEEDSTVVFKAPPVLAPSDAGDTTTVVMKGPRPPASSEPTMIMGPGAVTAIRAAAAPDLATLKVGAETRPPVPRSTAAAAQTAEIPKPAVPALEETRAMPGGTNRAGISPKALLAGAGGLFALAVIVVGVVLSRRGVEDAVPSPPPPTAPSATAPSVTVAPVAVSGSIRVETEPPGAAVTVNGETQGSSPLDLAEVPLGAYEIKVELKGYEPKTQSLALTEEAPRGEVKLALVRAAPTTGLADIVSTPFGAAVEVDGARVGLTPLTSLRLKPGTHLVEVSREGYDSWSGSLLVQAGRRSRLDATLRAHVKATPTPPPVEVVDPSRVYANTPAEVDTPARKTGGPNVSYPESAPRLKSGASVSVSVTYVVSETGEVADARVVESAGKVLDEAVLAAVRKWKYAPATKKGTNVKVQMTFRQTFRAE
jgi:TonB family protein